MFGLVGQVGAATLRRHVARLALVADELFAIGEPGRLAIGQFDDQLAALDRIADRVHMRAAFERCRAVTRSLGLREFAEQRFEADDIIGTLATRARAAARGWCTTAGVNGVTEAVLLVGGQGTRLRPLTINTPKPMLPVAGVPFTVHQITRARDAGDEEAGGMFLEKTCHRSDIPEAEIRKQLQRRDLGGGGVIIPDEIADLASVGVRIFFGEFIFTS